VRTVLIADDESDLREILVEYLGGRGFEVIEAANGLETLLQVKRRRPGAVVLDLRMPRLGGSRRSSESAPSTARSGSWW
jgi:CheY-like chemotaxis protein